MTPVGLELCDTTEVENTCSWIKLASFLVLHKFILVMVQYLEAIRKVNLRNEGVGA